MQVVPLIQGRTMKEFLSSVSEKGQVTIPKEMREALGVKPKDKVAFKLDGNEIKVVPVGSPVESSFQAVPALKKPMSLDELTEIAAEEHAQHVAQEGL